MSYVSRQHALNEAASLREEAGRWRTRADRNTRTGDVFGACIAAGNARVCEAQARLADEAAELLKPRRRRTRPRRRA